MLGYRSSTIWVVMRLILDTVPGHLRKLNIVAFSSTSRRVQVIRRIADLTLTHLASLCQKLLHLILRLDPRIGQALVSCDNVRHFVAELRIDERFD